MIFRGKKFPVLGVILVLGLNYKNKVTQMSRQIKEFNLYEQRQFPDLSKSEDFEHIKWSQQGDVKSFDVLIESYQPEALNIAYCILGNRNDAEDTCQEV